MVKKNEENEAQKTNIKEHFLPDYLRSYIKYVVYIMYILTFFMIIYYIITRKKYRD
jgi:hypothetical protein